MTRNEEIEMRAFQRLVTAVEKIADQCEVLNDTLLALSADLDEVEDDS